MISQWYEPETGSAAHPAAIARSLRDRGHEVDVLTGFPSYPSGRVHSGYRMRLRQQEARDGVRILRVPDVPSHDDNAVRRAASLTSFAASATTQVGWLRSVDVCLVYLTPATVGLAAMTLRRLTGVPYVLYVQDLWPETVTASGFIRNPRVARQVELLVTTILAHLYRKADGIAALSPTMATMLATRGSTSKPVAIPNWVDEDIFAPASPPLATERVLPGDKRWIMYAGGVGDVQALEHAVLAIELLSDRPHIGLVVVGDGVALPRLRQLAERQGVGERVLFLGSCPMTGMPSLMTEAMAQLISLRDLPLFRATIPSKVQASMACGAPVVCAVAGDAAALVERTRCGVVVHPEDPTALAEAFRTIDDLSDADRIALGERGRRAYVEELSASVGVSQLERLLVAAASRIRR